MAYKCVHCSKILQDNSPEVISGCGNCHSKFFFYIKEEKLKQIQLNEDADVNLSSAEKKQMESDIREIAGIKDEEKPVFLDFESVRVLKPGKYHIDLTKLLSSHKPRIYQLEDGKYIVDLSSSVKSSKPLE